MSSFAYGDVITTAGFFWKICVQSYNLLNVYIYSDVRR